MIRSSIATAIRHATRAAQTPNVLAVNMLATATNAVSRNARNTLPHHVLAHICWHQAKHETRTFQTRQRNTNAPKFANTTHHCTSQRQSSSRSVCSQTHKILTAKRLRTNNPYNVNILSHNALRAATQRKHVCYDANIVTHNPTTVSPDRSSRLVSHQPLYCPCSGAFFGE